MNKSIKNQVFYFFALACLLSFGTQIQAQVSDTQAVQIKLAIKSLVDEYAISRDSNDAEGYANTFAEGGTLELYGNEYSRDGLRERVESSNPNAVSMHHMATGQITIEDENNASGVHYFTLYTGTKGEDHEEGAAVNIASFTVMGKYHDQYVLTDEGWKFASRSVEAVFRPE